MTKTKKVPLVLLVLLALSISAVGLQTGPAVAQENQDKPIIVCTTNVLGSIVKEIVDEDVEMI